MEELAEEAEEEGNEGGDDDEEEEKEGKDLDRYESNFINDENVE